MLQRTRFWIRRIVLLVVLLAFLLLALRVAVTERGPALEPWHTWLPAEMSDRQMDRSDWSAYLRNEQQIFARMKIDVRPSENSADSYNRYAEKSPVYPARFATDWNRSYQLLPQGKPRGAVVLLHGLTDSPYSLRHFAADYQQHGYVVVAIRLPGHGTVPAALTQTEWEDWLAATRLAVREAIGAFRRARRCK